MPVVGSSAYNTAGQITSLVRSLLNDAQGNLFTDTVLLPYLNSAYRKVQRAIGNAGGGTGCFTAGFDQRCDGAAEPVADGPAGAAEAVGAAEFVHAGI